MFRQALLDLRTTLLWYGAGLIVYSAVIISIYPMFQDMMGEFENLIELYPESVLRAFGLEGDFATFEAFLGVEYLNVIWPIIVSIFVIMAGTATVAREIEQGTADLWLSVPEERWRLLVSKAAALALGLGVLVTITVGSIAIGAVLIGESLPFEAYLSLFLVLFSFPFAVLAYSILLSSLFSERGKAAGIAAGLTMLSYLTWVIAGLTDRWEWLKYISIFTAYRPQYAMETGTVPWLNVAILAGVGVIALMAGLIVFQRRDVATA
jgi:ABC-2 type transport system permease protein